MKPHYCASIFQLFPNRIQTPLALTLVAMVSGCSNMSGLDASSNYACPAPPGVVCKPMSEVYRSPARSASAVPADTAMANAHEANSMHVGIKSAGSELPVTPFLPDDAFPLRSQPKVLRIWAAPYGDTDGDLHEDHRMYLQVDSGHWMIEHHQTRIQNAFAPLRAPVAEKNAVSNDATKPDKRPNARSDAQPGALPAPPSSSPDLFDNAPDTGVLK